MFRRPTRLQSAFAVLATLVVAATFVISTNATAQSADDAGADSSVDETAGADTSSGAEGADIAGDLDDAADGPALRISGPDTVGAGPFTLTVTAEDLVDAAAFESVVRHTGSLALTDATAGDARVLQVPQTDGTALAVIPCGAAGCDESPDLVLTFTPDGPGDYEIDLVSSLVVDAAGRSLDHASRGTTVRVADGTVARSSVRTYWDTDRATDEATRADVTGDGHVTSVDITEAVIAWTETRISGEPCSLDPVSALADVNDDGCADISDLQSLTVAAATDAIAGGIGDATDDGVDSAESSHDGPQGIHSGGAGLVDTGIGASLAGIAAPAQVSTTFVVNTVNDGFDTQLNDDQCISNLGGCSLRAAILQSNATAGPNRIEFAIPGSGPHRITLTKRLPTINDTTGPVTIDGYTQSGATPNTDPVASNAQIKIEIRGLGSGNDNAGAAMNISSGGNVVRGLAIFDAFYAIAVLDTAAIGNQFHGNFLGTDAAGSFGSSSAFTLGAGIWLFDGPKNTIIGTPALADRNVISGNRTVGVKVEQGRTHDTVVQNNILGMRPSLTDRLPNNAAFDLQWRSKRTIIGGTGVNEGNLISGNSYAGIDLSHTTSANQVLGNRIGTDVTGTSATATTGNGDGILIKDNPFGNVIAHNVISGNDQNGIWGKHNYTDANTIRDNLIGIGVDGSAVPNRDWGIWLTGESDLITGNVIAYNDDGGIFVNDSNGNHSNYPAERTRQNRITANSFFGNGGLAIDIEPVGVNVNDPGDADAGVHDLLNHPEVTTLSAGNIDGTACPSCTVEIYVADNGSDSHGEGRQLVASVIADAGGAFSLDSAQIVADRIYTLLTIDPVGNTSEFGPRVGATGPAQITPTLLEGAFEYETIAGEVFAITHGLDRNDGGADATSSKVHFTFDVDNAGIYNIVGRIFAPDSSSDSFWVQMDGEPAPDGIYWDTPSTGLDDALITDAGNPVEFVLDEGSHTLTLSRREDDIGIASIRLVPIGGSANTAPDVTDPGTQTSDFDETVDLPLTAIDADGDVLTFFASGLPSGLSIDQATGAISGVTTGAGDYVVQVHAFDGTDTTSISIPWTVAPPNMGPTITDPGPQTGTQGSSVDLPIIAVDPDDDPVTFSATGLPDGLSIDETSGIVSGTLDVLGTFESVVTATDGPHPTDQPITWTVTPAPFECTVDGPSFTLSWTDQGASQYYIRHLLEGADTYVGASTGTSRSIANLDGTYLVRHVVNGVHYDTTCDGPGNPLFECTVDGPTFTLSWTDMGASAYYIRHMVGASDTYVGSSSTTSRSVATLDGTYLVRYFASGQQYDTTCDGPGNPAYECSVDGPTKTLSWTDMGASTYYIRHMVGTSDIYLGSETTTSRSVASLDGTYLVRHFVNGAAVDTTCDGPGNPPFECSVDGATMTLSWTDLGATTYYAQHAKNGTNTYLGSTAATSRAIVDLDGTYGVWFFVNGVRTDTTCDGPGNPPFECAVDSATMTLSWTDAGASVYYVRHMVGGQDNYLGSSTGTSRPITNLDGTYLVKYHVAGSTFQTTCSLP